MAPGAAGMRARAAGLQHARLGHRCVAIGCRFGWFGFFSLYDGHSDFEKTGLW